MDQLSDERGHPDLTDGNKKDDLLSEDTLRQLSKSLTSLVPKNGTGSHEPSLRHLQDLHQDLLRIANSTTLSPAHGSASLSTLCGFLERCSGSSTPEHRDLVFSPAAWIKAFNIFLEKSERHKAKPMRRLLLTLVDILSKQPREDVKRSLVGHAVSRTVRALGEQQDIASIKPAIQTLEHLIHRGFTTACELVTFSYSQIEAPLAIKPLASSSFSIKEVESSEVTGTPWIKSAENFTLSILRWVQYPDCAPAAGRFLSTFFKSLIAYQDDTAKSALEDRELPIWITPIEDALERQPELLEVLETHVLPGLLQLNPRDTRAFLNTLPLDKISRGDVGLIRVSDLQLCIMVARMPAVSNMTANNVPKEPGEIEEVPDTEATELGNDDHGNRLIEISRVGWEKLGIELLEHASSSVRIAALSLLISSSSSSKPLSSRVLYHLQMCLPRFHVEANAKPRNEFIALMKKLCMRLRGASIFLLRTNRAQEALDSDEDRDSPANIIRDNPKPRSSVDRYLELHFAFRRWYLLFLIHELRPTASYQSHITALRVLHPILGAELTGRLTLSKSNIEYFKALNEPLPLGLLMRPVLDLLLDPFDDVRQWAAWVYELLSRTNFAWPFPEKTSEDEGEIHKRHQKNCHVANGMIRTALLRAESKAGITGRADHADGVGRYYNILYGSCRVIEKPTGWHDSSFLLVDHLISRLEKEVKLAKDDLLQAVGNATLHGHLIALRHIASRPDYFTTLTYSAKAGYERWRESTERIHLVCRNVWEVVRNTLCFDAPEGHGLDEEGADENDLGTKDTLSFCWRALKESSSLLHIIVTNKGYGPVSSGDEALKYDDYYKIGDLSFTQLAELRHRGAFSTVSHTFASCCMACADSSDPGVVDLVKAYYCDALACMHQNASALTRRSAGMPAMIIGVLAAFQGSETFNDVLLDLQAIADTPIEDFELGDTRLPQVHALNCLKDIFTDARFGLSTEMHVADTLEIAASCLESQVWELRNCGLMLFKAVLRRLNGGTDTTSTRVSSSHRRSSIRTYETYPNLPGLVLKLLCNGRSLTVASPDLNGDEAHLAAHAHRIFSALEIVERSGLPAQHCTEILAAIWYHLECPDWAVREKAAKALSFALNGRDLIREIERLLSPSWPLQNALHGRLLCVRFMLARTDIPLLTYERLVPLVNALWETIIVGNPCPITIATYSNLLADLCIILLRNRSLVTESVLDQLTKMPSFQADELGKKPALALQSSALRRCLAMKASIKRIQLPLDQLPQWALDAIVTLDDTRKNFSDENCIAMFRLVPANELRQELGIIQYVDTSLADNRDNAHEADLALVIRGYDIGMSYTEIEDSVSQSQLSTWIHMLSVAGSENSELRTRIAAAHSLKGFFDGLLESRWKPEPAPPLLGVFLALYDTLVDDDEDVRDQGAKIVSSLLSAIKSDPSNGTTISLSLSPPAAKCRLLRFLEKGCRKSTAMFIEAVRRLVGLKSLYRVKAFGLGENVESEAEEVALQLRPVAELSREAQKMQIAVFVEEKQNLYFDTVREADDWAALIVQIDPNCWNPILIAALDTWTIDGLTYFIEKFERSHDSGALGPTSKPEVYTLWMRIILSARVLMTPSASATAKGTGKENTCRALLEKLLELGRQRLLHELLVDRILFILEDVPHPYSTAVA